MMTRTTPLLAIAVLFCACSGSDGDGALTDDAQTDGAPIDGAIVDSASPGDDAPPTDTAGSDVAIADAKDDSTTTLPSEGCGKAATAGSTKPSITVAGTKRDYVLSIPAGYDPNRGYPLVFGWHGRTDNGTNMQKFSGVEKASAGAAIFVYPDGLTVTPGTPSDTGWELGAKGRDVALFDGLVVELAGKLCVDRKRIHSFGFSFGGYMSNALGCYRGGSTIRAIAPVAGGPSTSGCTAGPVAVWLSHATDDGSVNLTEGTKSRDFWIKQGACDAKVSSPTPPDPCIAYASWKSAAPVVWCQRPTGGHSWPSFAGQAIWDFFAAQK